MNTCYRVLGALVFLVLLVGWVTSSRAQLLSETSGVHAAAFHGYPRYATPVVWQPPAAEFEVLPGYETGSVAPLGDPGSPFSGTTEMCGCEVCLAGTPCVDSADYVDFLDKYGGAYGDGSATVHWFDVQAEFMYLKREHISRRNIPFTSKVQGSQDYIILSSKDLEFDHRPGFRLTGTFQWDASSHLEASYFGTFHWLAHRTVTSNFNDLYSPFSDFGKKPSGGYQETDQAYKQGIRYSSDLNNVELNWRRHWMAPNYWFQGSWLFGVRYVRLAEDFEYFSRTNDFTPGNKQGSMDYYVETTNNLIGLQLGGDLLVTLLPGVTAGAEAKVGIYGNDSSQHTNIIAKEEEALLPIPREAKAGGDAAFVAEAGAMLIWQIRPWLALRGGYQVLILDGVALAPENFNSEPPQSFQPPEGGRNIFLDHNGYAFYHGFTTGVEWLW